MTLYYFRVLANSAPCAPDLLIAAWLMGGRNRHMWLYVSPVN